MHLIGKINGADCDAGSFDDGVAAAGLYSVPCEPNELCRHKHNVEDGLADLRVPAARAGREGGGESRRQRHEQRRGREQEAAARANAQVT